MIIKIVFYGFALHQSKGKFCYQSIGYIRIILATSHHCIKANSSTLVSKSWFLCMFNIKCGPIQMWFNSTSASSHTCTNLLFDGRMALTRHLAPVSVMLFGSSHLVLSPQQVNVFFTGEMIILLRMINKENDSLAFWFSKIVITLLAIDIIIVSLL